MNLSLEEKLKANSKKFVMLQIVEAPAAIMLALGLSAKFSENGTVVFAFLESATTVNTLLIAGGILMGLGVIKTVSLLLEKRQIMQQIRQRQHDR